jgi:hypothetical protein
LSSFFADKCNYFLHNADNVSQTFRYLNDMNVGMFVRDNQAVSIINKVIKSNDFVSFEKIAGSQTPFGIVTSFKDYSNVKDKKNDMRIYGNRFVGYTSMKNVSKNQKDYFKFHTKIINFRNKTSQNKQL